MSGFGGPSEAGARPQMVTIAAIVLIVGGALGVLGGLALLGLGGLFAAAVGAGALAFLFGLITLALGAGQVWVGLQILKLTAAGLKFGLLISYVSIVVSILSDLTVGSIDAGTIISLVIPGFVIWALNQNKGAFSN